MNANAQFNVIRDVMGDIVDPFVPTVTMKVNYGDHEVTNSSVLKALVTQSTPRVIIGGESNALYTLVMIDPDAPNPNEPTLQEVVAWFISLSFSNFRSHYIKISIYGRVFILCHNVYRFVCCYT